MLPLEGFAVAAYVARVRPQAAALLDEPTSEEPKGCIFADPDGALHCTVYPARPLECRLFAFSGARDKSGSPVFRLCRHMPGPEPRSMDAATMLGRWGELPPLMPDWSVRVESLDAGKRAPLREQARAAWSTLSWFRDPGNSRAC